MCPILHELTFNTSDLLLYDYRIRVGFDSVPTSNTAFCDIDNGFLVLQLDLMIVTSELVMAADANVVLSLSDTKVSLNITEDFIILSIIHVPEIMFLHAMFFSS